MMVLLYGVTDGQLAAQLGDGLAGGRLRHLTYRHLSAVVSDIDRAPIPGGQTLWAYESVIERLMDSCTLLPARFGATATGEREITDMLVARRVELTAALERVRCAVEFAVHAAPPTTITDSTDSTDGEGPGTAYLRRRLSEQVRTRELATEVRAVAGDLVRAERTGSTGSVAYLVVQSAAEDFVQRTTAVGATVTGPWPPYSFVGGMP
jgi:hypothetical protein